MTIRPKLYDDGARMSTVDSVQGAQAANVGAKRLPIDRCYSPVITCNPYLSLVLR